MPHTRFLTSIILSSTHFANLIHGFTLKNILFENMTEQTNSLDFSESNREKSKENLLNFFHGKFKKIYTLHQTHSDQIINLDEMKEDGFIPSSDSIITSKRNILIGVLTADCVPILLFDPTQNIIAAVHAGWKGLLNRILIKTVEKMKTDFNVNEKNIYSVLGPCIGKCCYEVENDLYSNFLSEFKDFQMSNFASVTPKKIFLDLGNIAFQQLLAVGLIADNVELMRICTKCDKRFFSYRRDRFSSGRQLSFLGVMGN